MYVRSHIVSKIDIKSLYKYDSYISLDLLFSILNINIIVLLTAKFYVSLECIYFEKNMLLSFIFKNISKIFK